MRGTVLIILVLGFAALGCVGEQPEMNYSNVSNITEEEPPIYNCTGPVCGEDGNTYNTDCDAMDANATILHVGPCEAEEECTDSDGGVEPGGRGTASKGNESHTDYCIDAEQLIEYSCLDNSITMVKVMCGGDEDCKDGECVSRPEPNITIGCTGPIEPDIYAQESVTANGSTYTDTCIEFKTVKDYYCRDNELLSLNHECPPGYGCQEGRCLMFSMECTETDGGNDLLVRGKTTVTKGLLVIFTGWDECIDEGLIKEHYCLENGSAVTEETLCGSGLKCVSDRCVTSKCSETDGGLDIYKAGTTTVDDVEYKDDCINDDEVREYYCYGDEVEKDDKNCGKGYICDRNRCVEGSRS